MKSTSEEREAITLINQDQKMFGILHRPCQPGPVPAVLICSGYAGNKAGKFRLFVRLAEELVKQGIAVLRFDYRGSGDSEGDLQEITVESKVSDTLMCLDFLANDPQIDPSRIGLLGRSMGGAISILAAKKFSKIKSLALWAPVFDSSPWKPLWDSFKSNQLNSNQKLEILQLPLGVPNPRFLQQFFQVQTREELNALKELPLLHIEAAKDEVVKHSHGEAYRVAREGLPTRYIQLMNSDHDFSNAEDQAMAIKETSQWFSTTLN